MASGDLLCVWTPLGNEPPTTSYATVDVRNGRVVLDFDAASTESAVFSGVLPENYDGGGLTTEVTWTATSATTGNAVVGVDFERATTDYDADSFATQNTATTACSGTSGIPVTSTITHTDGAAIDSIAAGDLFRVRVQRLGGNGSDTMAGDLELLSVAVFET